MARIQRTRAAVFGLHDILPLDLTLPDYIDDGIWKCRVVYGKDIEQITFEPYQGRTISSIQIIHADTELVYRHKGDRSELIRFYDQRGDADDILIIQNGFVTDSYWSNVVLSQSGKWYTPATPLLRGVMRQSLLDQGLITERIIRETDLESYDQIMTINALNPYDLERGISTKSVIL